MTATAPLEVDQRTELERKAAQLRGVAIVETASYALLFLFWKILDNEIGTSLMGFFHGWIVIGFMVMVVWITPGMKWKWWFPVLVLITGPLGGILVHEAIRRHRWDRTR
jgi:Domain of unknown function (DUF3817)